MAVTRTGSVTRIDNSANSGSQSVTVPSDAEVIVVGVSGYEGSATYLSSGTLTIAGQALTLQANENNTSSNTTGMFYRLSPTTGSQTLAWDWAGTSAPDEGMSLFVAFYLGIDTGSPIRDSDIATNGGELPDNVALPSMTVVNGDAAVVVAGGNGTTTWTNATELADGDFNTGTMSFAEAFPTGDVVISASGLVFISLSAIVLAGEVVAVASGGGAYGAMSELAMSAIQAPAAAAAANIPEFVFYYRQQRRKSFI